MTTEDKIREHNPWRCINCNYKYNNAFKEMELIMVTPEKYEFRCGNCDAHIHVPVESRLKWHEAERTTG